MTTKAIIITASAVVLIAGGAYGLYRYKKHKAAAQAAQDAADFPTITSVDKNSKVVEYSVNGQQKAASLNAGGIIRSGNYTIEGEESGPVLTKVVVKHKGNEITQIVL